MPGRPKSTVWHLPKPTSHPLRSYIRVRIPHAINTLTGLPTRNQGARQPGPPGRNGLPSPPFLPPHFLFHLPYTAPTPIQLLSLSLSLGYPFNTTPDSPLRLSSYVIRSPLPIAHRPNEENPNLKQSQPTVSPKQTNLARLSAHSSSAPTSSPSPNKLPSQPSLQAATSPQTSSIPHSPTLPPLSNTNHLQTLPGQLPIDTRHHEGTTNVTKSAVKLRWKPQIRPQKTAPLQHKPEGHQPSIPPIPVRISPRPKQPPSPTPTPPFPGHLPTPSPLAGNASGLSTPPPPPRPRISSPSGPPRPRHPPLLIPTPLSRPRPRTVARRRLLRLGKPSSLSERPPRTDPPPSPAQRNSKLYTSSPPQTTNTDLRSSLFPLLAAPPPFSPPPAPRPGDWTDAPHHPRLPLRPRHHQHRHHSISAHHDHPDSTSPLSPLDAQAAPPSAYPKTRPPPSINPPTKQELPHLVGAPTISLRLISCPGTTPGARTPHRNQARPGTTGPPKRQALDPHAHSASTPPPNLTPFDLPRRRDSLTSLRRNQLSRDTSEHQNATLSRDEATRTPILAQRPRPKDTHWTPLYGTERPSTLYQTTQRPRLLTRHHPQLRRPPPHVIPSSPGLHLPKTSPPDTLTITRRKNRHAQRDPIRGASTPSSQRLPAGHALQERDAQQPHPVGKPAPHEFSLGQTTPVSSPQPAPDPTPATKLFRTTSPLHRNQSPPHILL
uniref:Uncharacterized protein n=1 Tax=Knipowitschia caucasica TaxID=637954 RepID=A0AAV2MK85_KNICA